MGFPGKCSMNIPFPNATDDAQHFENYKEIQRWADRLLRPDEGCIGGETPKQWFRFYGTKTASTAADIPNWGGSLPYLGASSGISLGSSGAINNQVILPADSYWHLFVEIECVPSAAPTVGGAEARLRYKSSVVLSQMNLYPQDFVGVNPRRYWMSASLHIPSGASTFSRSITVEVGESTDVSIEFRARLHGIEFAGSPFV